MNENIYALNLFFTGKCNLNCSYCFVNKKGVENATLGERQLKKSVDLLLSFPGKKKTISFNGGEPTLEWPLVKKIYKYTQRRAKKKKIVLDVAVMTNGTLLNQEMADFFAQNGIIVKVSIDGGKLSHDKNRPFKKNPKASSFDRIIKNIDGLKTDNIQLAASMVFTPGDLNMFLDNIKFLNSKNFRYIEFYPDLYADWREKDLKKMEKEFKRFENYYLGLFKKNKKTFKNSLLSMFINDVELGRMEKCGKIHVNAEGEFYACDKVFSLEPRERKKYIIGDVKKGIDEKKRKNILRDLRKEFFEKSGLKCRKCEYFNYCFCPVGHVIHLLDSKKKQINGGNFWKSFCRLSMIYNKTFLKIKEKLMFNSGFIEMYRY